MEAKGIRLADLAARVGARVRGDPGRSITGVATLERAEAGHLAFLTNPRDRKSAEATRAGLEKKKAELAKAEQDDQRRTLELLEAIGAKRKVVERAAADAETARDNALYELGERKSHNFSDSHRTP